MHSEHGTRPLATKERDPVAQVGDLEERADSEHFEDETQVEAGIETDNAPRGFVMAIMLSLLLWLLLAGWFAL